MQEKPKGLRHIIREMAKRIALKNGYGIDEAALKRISRIPLRYWFLPSNSVDLARLEEMIGDIIQLATKFTTPPIRDVIDRKAIKKALIEVKCHYLWFC